MIYPIIYITALQSALIYLLSIGDLSANIPQFWLGVLFATVAYALSAKAVIQGNFFSTKTILVFAVIFRITMWFSTPSLSDDIYRYLWDGHVQLSGINPYIFPPNSNELLEIRNDIFPLVNHRDIPTIYPPLAQLFFALCALAGKSVGIFKAFLLFVEGLLCLLLVRLLIDRKMDPRRIILYAWHPLTIIEIAGNGHIDVLGIFLMMAFLFSLGKNQFLFSSLSLAFGFLSKIVPILLLPLAVVQIIRKTGNNYKVASFLTIFFLAVTIISAPYINAGFKMFSGLFIYAKIWHFNDLFHGILSTTLESLQIHNGKHARSVCILFLLTTLLYSIYKQSDPLRIAFSTICAFIVFSPTLHPWYLLWITPFFCLFPNISWITFSCLVFLGYNVLTNYKTNGVWNEEYWVLLCEYVPLILILIWEKTCKNRV